jgi:hypothetical protein
MVRRDQYYFWSLASIVGATVTAPTLLAIAVLARPGSYVRMRLQCIWRAVRLVLYGYMLFSWTILISSVLQYHEPRLREDGDAHGGEPQFARREYMFASFLNPVCAGALFALTCPPVRIEVQRRQGDQGAGGAHVRPWRAQKKGGPWRAQKRGSPWRAQKRGLGC